MQTVDVFAPSVDDPYRFGQIAAANSLSDVYAMGGRPITALSIIGFPVGELPDEALRAILRGGIDKMAEAGVPVIGGHSINDAAVKAGFAVTGLVAPRQMLTNAAAQPGDRLVLTKPLGTGIVAFAAQIGRLSDGAAEEAARSMAALNRRAAELMVQFHAHACTDVTGFGLMGHLAALAAASGVDVEIALDQLPLLPGVRQCMAEGIFPGAVERNREASAAAMTADEGLSPNRLDLCFDPQTSGGLLIAAAPAAAVALLARLHAEDMPAAAVIGRVLGPGSGRVFVREKELGTDFGCAKSQGISDCGFGIGSEPAASNPQPANPQSLTVEEKIEMSDCCGEHGAATGSVASAARQKYKEFVEAAHAPGALDARTKQALALALSVAARRAVRETPPPEGAADGLFRGSDRRGGLDGRRLRRLSGDGVLQRGPQKVKRRVAGVARLCELVRKKMSNNLPWYDRGTLFAGVLLMLVPAAVAGDRPQLWIGPSGYDNGRCLRELFEKPDAWRQTRSVVDVLIYADHALKRQFSDDEPAALVRPVAAMEPQVRHGSRGHQALGRHRREILQHRAAQLGAGRAAGRQDTPCAIGRAVCILRKHLHKPDDYACEETAAYIALVRKHFPAVLIGDIETYPSIPTAEHFQWIEAPPESPGGDEGPRAGLLPPRRGLGALHRP